LYLRNVFGFVSGEHDKATFGIAGSRFRATAL
jgi:hypothetical protein